MSFRKRTVGSKKLEAMRRGKEAARMARPLEPRPPDLPELRRQIVIIDHDFGTVEHRIDLFRTGRIDCYRVVADGAEWKRRAGWSTVLEALRKSFLRVGSPTRE